MEINQSIENALRLADLDLYRIQNEIDADFAGSMEAYFDHVRHLSTEFETALALLVLNSSPQQVATFVNLNLTKIDLSIRQIKLFDEVCVRCGIDSDPDGSDIMDGFFRPIHQAHLSHLVYIERLLKNVLENINGYIPVVDSMADSVPVSEMSEDITVSAEIDLLNDYGELLSIKDMQAIFKVERNAIYTYENEGHFKRCSAPYKTVMFRKEDIKRYFLSRI